MKKVTVLGMYIGKEEGFGTSSGSTNYGNLLGYPGVLARQVLETQGFTFFSELELPPEKADIIFCIDLTPELWKRILTLPQKIKKILQACESPIYARYSHFASQVLMSPVWDCILTWNRSYEADYILHYDIPVTGKRASLVPDLPQWKKTEKSSGVVVSSFKLGDTRGMAPQREQLYLELSALGEVDLYGKNWQLDLSKHRFGSTNNKLQTLAQYSFALAVENAWAPGYVTEKLPDCILAGIPVLYWGDIENAQRRFPDTFVPLGDLTLSAFWKAREQLFRNYTFHLQAVHCEREKSDSWCNSYLDAMQYAFRHYL